MSAWIVLVTLASLFFYAWTGNQVSSARRKFNIPAPATTGNADFERVFRVQMNTLEWLPLFLGCLWIFSLYWDDRATALIGAVWIVGRILYAHGYAAAANQRSTGFAIQGIAVLLLFLGGLVGAIMSLFGVA